MATSYYIRSANKFLKRLLPKARVRPQEGDVFDVPLRGGGWCVGLLARISRDGICVAYFHGPRLLEPPAPDDLVMPSPSEAVLVTRFGVAAFTSRAWTIRGTAPNWNRTLWAPTAFYEEKPFGGIRVIEYDDKNPNLPVTQRPGTNADLERLPEGDLHGYIVVEGKLSQLLPRVP